jgi:hypothetical protein
MNGAQGFLAGKKDRFFCLSCIALGNVHHTLSIRLRLIEPKFLYDFIVTDGTTSVPRVRWN